MRKFLYLVIGLVLASSSFAQGDAKLRSSDELRKELTRGPVIRPKIAPDGYTAPETSPVISLPTILFELNSSELLASSRAQLDEVVTAILGGGTRGPVIRPKVSTEKPPYKILIEGHTCDRGNESTNLRLSKQRALAVSRYLVSKGIDDSILEYEGRGEQRPVVPNTGESQREQNRRVDFVLRSLGAEVEDSAKGSPATRGVTVSRSAPKGFLDVTFRATRGRTEYVNDEIEMLRNGDHFKVSITVLEGCFIYILGLESEGGVGWIYPAEGEVGVWCYYNARLEFPGNGEAFKIQGAPGDEVVCVIASQTSVADPSALPQILKKHGASLTPNALREATDTKDVELHILTIDHQD